MIDVLISSIRVFPLVSHNNQKMASIKFFAAIFCAFLIIQTQARGQSGTEVQDNAIDTVKKAVKAIEKIIDGVLSLLTDELERIDNNIEAIRVNATRIFTDVVEVSAARIEKYMAKIGADGNDDLKALMDCFQSGNEFLKAVLLDIFESTSQCGSPDLIKIVGALHPVIGDLQKVQGDVKAAADKIDECNGDNLSAIMCAVNVAKDVLGVLKEIPDAIGNDAKNAIDVASTSLADYRQCLKTGYGDLQKGVIGMINQISSCARG